MCAFVVFGLVFSIPSQEIGLENVSEMTWSVSSGTENHNSVNQCPEEPETNCFSERWCP